MRRLLIAFVALLPTFAFAGGYRRSIEDASASMDQAHAQARRGGPACRNAMKAAIDRATDDVDELMQDRGERRLYEVREAVNALAIAAPRESCPESVGKSLSNAVQALDEARRGWANRDRDRDDRQFGLPDNRVAHVSTPVDFAQLRLTPNVIHDTENKVQVDIPEVRFHQQRGLKFRLGLRVRAQNGQFGEWVVDNMYQVPQDEYVWANATMFYIRHSTLRGIDTANGKFVVRVSVLGENNEELGAVDQPLQVNFRGPMVPPPPAPMAPPGQPYQRPTPVAVQQQRDCGTGADPGCNLSRNGVTAMERATFEGLIRSMQANPSEITREQMVMNVLRNNGMTAAQFGQVLDQFRSEMSKINVTRQAAPRLTNPGAALGFSTKFRSGIQQGEYVKIISAER